MVRESRIIADLLLKQASEEEWQQKIHVENALQKRSPATAKRNAQAIKKRLELIEPEFWRALRDGDDELATQVAFVGVLERNLLIVEFMEQVLKDLYTVHAKKVELYHWLDFLDDCGNKDKKIVDWKESTKKKMGQVVFRILIEAGFMDNARSKKLQPVVIRPEVKSMLENTFKPRLLACMDISK